MQETPDRIMYDYSYANLLLYSAATPQYDDEDNDWDTSKDANIPSNYKQIDGEIYI